MSFVSALGIAPLRGKAVITTNAVPTLGDCNTYSTTTTGGDLIIPLPQVATQTVGAQMLLEKDPTDTTLNEVTFTTYGSDQFTDGATSLTLTNGGQSRIVQVVNMGGALQWKVVGGLGTAGLTEIPATPDPDPHPDINADLLRFTQDIATATATGYGGYGGGDYGYSDYGYSGYGYGQ